MSFDERFQEVEETCPGGGAMTYRIQVEEPDQALGELQYFIGIEEGSTEHSTKDSLWLDMRTVEWLYEKLGSARQYIRRRVAGQSPKEALAKPTPVGEDVRPDFFDFVTKLRSESKWIRTIHGEDCSAADQRSLDELADKVEQVGKKLGFL